MQPIQHIENCFRKGKARLALTFPYVFTIALCLLFIMPTYAQNATPAPVTDDQVNAVAARMYCPSCQGVPLDVCGTQVCIDWRQEIRTQLEAGHTADEIIANFVSLYGERIVGTPQDPTLRAFSLITPYALGVLVLLIGLWTLIRWWRSRRVPMDYGLTTKEKGTPLDDDDYRSRIEQDLQ